MLIRSVYGTPFVTYPRVDRAFPSQGVMLLTGLNGAGKSSLYEMVAWCLYGQTVRDSKVVDASVTVNLDERSENFTVTRSRGKRGSATLTFKCGALDLTRATPTETQILIDQEFGSFEQYKAGRVFARDLLAKMALATDKERKNLLEELLGLQKFDKALKLARAEESKATMALGIADSEVPHRNAALEKAKQDEQALLAKEVRPLDVVTSEVLGFEKLIAEAEVNYADASRRYGDLLASKQAAERQLAIEETKYRERESRVRGLEAHLDKLQNETHCIQCGRELDPVSREESIIATEGLHEVAAKEAADQRSLAAARVRLSLLREELGEVRPEVDAMVKAKQTFSDALSQAKAEQRVSETIGEQRTRAATAVQEAMEALQLAQASRKAAEGAKTRAMAVSEALGLRGARCLLLGRALGRLEQEANLFLAQVHPTLRVKVRDKEDKVVIEVTGAGGGDYRGCSGGQRVLVDVALMLGMVTLRGGDGLLVFDEVFDSLDATRVEAVAEYLQGLARTRQVLIISHREDFAALFRTAARWRAVMDADGISTLEEA